MLCGTNLTLFFLADIFFPAIEKGAVMKIKSLLTLVLLYILLPLFSPAQVTIKGEIAGIVIDEGGVALPGATVTLTGKKLLQKSISVVSNERGGFRFLNLTPGIYEIEIILQGFKAQKYTNIFVYVGKSTPIKAKLVAETLKEEIEVIAKAPLIETKASNIIISIDNNLVENIPTSRNFSSYADLVNAVPGIYNDTAYGSGGGYGRFRDFSYGSLTTSYQFNGLNVDNIAMGYSNVNPIYETIEEIQIVGIGATAEYGNYTGATVNIVTKGGTNSLHGSLTGLYTDSNFYADNSPGNIQELTPYDYKYDAEISATFGGPVIREKLFFFLAGGFSGQRKNWPDFTEHHTQKRFRYYGKLDWLINSKNSVSMIVSGNPSSLGPLDNGPRFAESTSAKTEMDMISLHATWQSLLSKSSFIYVKLGGFKDRLTIEPVYPGIPTFANVDLSQGVYDYMAYGSFSYEHIQPSFRIEAQAALTHYIDDFLGSSHELKFGLEYSRAQTKTDYGSTGGGTLSRVVYGPITVWGATTGPEMHTQEILIRVGGYVQDNLIIGRRLSLNLGLRYEIPTITARDFQGDVAEFHLFSPRVGFSYDFGGDAKNVLHGSFGIFYNKLRTESFRSSMPGNTDLFSYTLFLPTESFDITDDNITEMFAQLTQPENLSMIRTFSVPVPVDPDLRQTRADYFNIGFAKQLGNSFALSIDYVYKRDRNRRQWLSLAPHTFEESQWTDPWLGNTITVWDQTDDLSNEDMFLTNSTWAKKRHHIIMVVLRKQPSQKWSMMASYVYQNSKGNLPNWGDNDLFVAPDFNMDNDPYYSRNSLQWGRQWDREHQFKLLVSYFGPWGILLSGNFQVLSGLPWQAEASSYDVGIYRSPKGGEEWQHTFDILLEPRGSRRTPFNWNFDLRLAKVFYIKDTHFELQIDIFNVFNNDYYSSIYTRPNDVYLDGTSAFGMPLRLDPPRHIRFGVTWRF